MSRLVTRRFEDQELGRWTMHTMTPTPSISPFVRAYQGYFQDVPRRGSHLTSAGLTHTLVINLGGRHRVETSGGPPASVDSFITGLYETPALVEASSFRGVEVDLTPLGAFRLLGGGLEELAGRTVPLEAALGREAGALIEQVGNSSSWGQRLAVVETFLSRRLGEGPAPRSQVQLAWDLILSSQGQVTVRRLLEETGWSRRHLSRAMSGDLGLTPKRLARLARFRRAMELLEGSTMPLAEVAMKAGYYDQAHMSNEVRAYSARTPAEVRRPPHREAVTFLQDRIRDGR